MIHYLMVSQDTACGSDGPAMVERSLVTCQDCIDRLAKWSRVRDEARAAWQARITGA